MSSAIFLIDFDNVRPDAGVAHRHRDTKHAADYVRRAALRHAGTEGSVTDVLLRYYGGWYLKRGDTSYDARDLQRWIPGVARREGGIRVVVELASALLEHPAHGFLGTFRLPAEQLHPPGCSGACSFHCSRRSQQKMVDMMLGLDLVSVAAREPAHVVLFSSDEDLFPAILASVRGSLRAASVTWLRPGRPSGDSPNDHHVTSTTLRIRDKTP